MMSDSVIDMGYCTDPIFNNEVVIMEDSKETSQEIIKVLSGELNWQIIQCKNQDEAVEIARKGRAAFFILDNWVGSKQEGLDALERIKAINRKTFVTIFTGHQIDRSLAEKLSGDLFEDKTDIPENVRHIAHSMLAYRKKLVGLMLRSIESQMQYIESLENNYTYKHELEDTKLKATHDKSKADDENGLQRKNRLNYKKMLSTKDWYIENKGKYVAFVDGEFKFSEIDRDTCISRIIDCVECRGKSVFYAKVERYVRSIDEPSSLSFELV